MKWQLLILATLAAHYSTLAQQSEYKVGCGIADVTGPAGEITFVSTPRVSSSCFILLCFRFNI